MFLIVLKAALVEVSTAVPDAALPLDDAFPDVAHIGVVLVGYFDVPVRDSGLELSQEHGSVPQDQLSLALQLVLAEVALVGLEGGGWSKI